MALSEEELQVQARYLVSEFMHGCMAMHHHMYEDRYWYVSEDWGLDEGLTLTKEEEFDLIEISWELMKEFSERLYKEAEEMKNA